MRIVAGSRKGHTIAAPKGLETRPTSDRVRENTFNLIGPLEDASVLDLFAGSGALGLEALSRGAARAVFVERDREACQTINRNLDKLRLAGASVLCREVEAFVLTERARYELILVDPPYEAFASLQPLLARYLPTLLAENGLLVLETAARDQQPELPLPVRTSRRYGSTRITLFGA